MCKKKTNFEGYLKKYCNKTKVSKEEALKHAVVRDVKQFYEKIEGEKITVSPSIFEDDFDYTEDKSC